MATGAFADETRLPQLRIDRHGDWFDGDQPITHEGLLANLRQSLRRDAAGYFVQTRVRIPVAVEDVPFVVIRVVRRGERLHVWLNDGTDEPVDPSSLRLGPGHVPYCAVKGGAFEARLDRAAAYQLLSLAHYDRRTGRGVLRLGAREHVLESP